METSILYTFGCRLSDKRQPEIGLCLQAENKVDKVVPHFPILLPTCCFIHLHIIIVYYSV